jgi:hypothetical protein
VERLPFTSLRPRLEFIELPPLFRLETRQSCKLWIGVTQKAGFRIQAGRTLRRGGLVGREIPSWATRPECTPAVGARDLLAIREWIGAKGVPAPGTVYFRMAVHIRCLPLRRAYGTKAAAFVIRWSQATVACYLFLRLSQQRMASLPPKITDIVKARLGLTHSYSEDSDSSMATLASVLTW